MSEVVILLTVVLAILLVSEVGYRAYLWAEIRARVRQTRQFDPLPISMVFKKSPWKFNPKWGYDYLFDTEILQTGIAPIGMTPPAVYRTTKEGNYPGYDSLKGQGVAFVDRPPTDYETADLKILVVGDSFSTVWPYLLDPVLG